jgi:hypothetical protein
MPAIAQNKVFVNSEDPQFGLFAFDATTGAFLWRNPTAGEPGSTVTVANGVVFEIAESGELMMLNSATGAFLGQISDPDRLGFNSAFGSQPAVVNGTVYIPTADFSGQSRVDAFRLPSAQGGVPTGTCVYQKLPIDDSLGEPSGINDVGAIVGSVFSRADGTTHGFLFFKGKTTLFRFPGSEFSTASSINNHAQIVGSLAFPDAVNLAGYVVRDGKFHLIVVPHSVSTVAVDINDKGDIVGNVTTNDGVAKGFLLHNGTFHLFRFPGAAETNVTGINRDGTIIGNYLATLPFDARTEAVNPPTHGFMVKNGVFTTLDFPGAQNTFPTRINNEGEIIGFFEGPDLAHGFSFQGGKFKALNDPPNTQRVTPVGLNNHDQIVTLSEFPSESFIGDCHAAF